MSTPLHHRERDRDRDRTTPRNRDRSSRATTTTTAAPPPPLPDYEPSIVPLTATGHNAVLALLKSQTLRHLKTHLQHAGLKLTDSAGEVNERVTDARVRYQKQRERGAKRREGHGQGQGQGEDGEGDVVGENENEGGEGEGGGEDEEERARLTSLEERVSGITKRLEEQVRMIVDAEAKVDALVEVMGGFEREADEASVARPARRTRGERSRRRRRRDEDEEEDESEEGEGEDEDEEDEDSVAASERDDAVAPPSRRLEENLNESYAQWDRLSLTQRYSANNTYVGFYRIVHEAQHPGNDIPPVPHASTWFSHLEDPNASTTSPTSTSHQATTTTTTTRHHQQPPTRNQRTPSPDDIAIESERLSLKCPLTLLTFRDPVTSTKCPHSFERDAIESMIAQSPTTVPAPPPAPGTAPPSRAARRVRSVKCPVCSVVLTGQDLRSDAVLLRRVKRAEARERERDDEDDDSGEEVSSSGRKRARIPVASDDEDEDRDQDEEDDEEDEEDSDENGDEDDESPQRKRRRRQATEEQVRIKQERAMSSSAPMMVD